MRLAYILSTFEAINAAIDPSDVVAQYDFTQAECHAGLVENVVEDGVFGDLILDDSVSCLDGVGVESNLSKGSPAAYSTGTNRAFRDALQEPEEYPGFTVELWVTLENKSCDAYSGGSSNCVYSLFAIHNPNLNDSSEDCKHNTDFQLNYHSDSKNFEARFRNLEKGCVSFETPVDIMTYNTLGYPFQFVFSSKELQSVSRVYGVLEFYINATRVRMSLGNAVLSDAILPAWHEDYTAQFLDHRRWPSSTEFEVRRAKLHSAKIYLTNIAKTTVPTIYAKGIANSTPVAYDVAIEINEDGEAGDHYEDPAAYLQPFPVTELKIINMKVYDSDNDPTTPNYRNDARPKAFVEVLPHTGQLIDAAGEDITTTPFEVYEEGGVFPVRYRPLFNEYSSSVYTSFSFYAEDGVTGIRSFTSATVTIYVTPKNDPPVAFNLNLDAYAGTHENIVQLRGSDVDDSDEVQGAEIVESPSNGKLYQVNTDGTVSTSTLSAGERVWTGQNVAYAFDNSILRSNSPQDQMVGSDSFSYRVCDSDQNFSQSATGNIIVYTGVTASDGDGRWTCYEDEECHIWLYGTAVDDSQANMWFTVIDIPTYGSLFDASSGDLVDIGSTLSDNIHHPYDIGAHVIYRSPADFFDEPTITWTGSSMSGSLSIELGLSFYTSIMEGDAKLSSTIAKQNIQVVNVNDNSSIFCPDEDVFEVQATNTVADTNDTNRPDRFVVSNVTLTDVDRSVDPVRVDLVTESGMVTLNILYLDQLNFDLDCAGPGASWQCRSDPKMQSEITFIGTPEDVELALNGMTYLSNYSNILDSIVMTIYDGSRGDCMSEQGFTTVSVRPFCAISTCKIRLSVGSYYREGGDGLNDDDQTTDDGTTNDSGATQDDGTIYDDGNMNDETTFNNETSVEDDGLNDDDQTTDDGTTNDNGATPDNGTIYDDGNMNDETTFNNETSVEDDGLNDDDQIPEGGTTNDNGVTQDNGTIYDDGNMNGETTFNNETSVEDDGLNDDNQTTDDGTTNDNGATQDNGTIYDDGNMNGETTFDNETSVEDDGLNDDNQTSDDGTTNDNGATQDNGTIYDDGNMNGETTFNNETSVEDDGLNDDGQTTDDGTTNDNGATQDNGTIYDDGNMNGETKFDNETSVDEENYDDGHVHEDDVYDHENVQDDDDVYDDDISDHENVHGDDDNIDDPENTYDDEYIDDNENAYGALVSRLKRMTWRTRIYMLVAVIAVFGILLLSCYCNFFSIIFRFLCCCLCRWDGSREADEEPSEPTRGGRPFIVLVLCLPCVVLMDCIRYILCCRGHRKRDRGPRTRKRKVAAVDREHIYRDRAKKWKRDTPPAKVRSREPQNPSSSKNNAPFKKAKGPASSPSSSKKGRGSRRHQPQHGHIPTAAVNNQTKKPLSPKRGARVKRETHWED